MFFSPFSIAISRYEKRELILVLFVRLSDLRSLFPLPLGVREGLWLVIVALTGLFSYLFCLILALIYKIYPSVLYHLQELTGVILNVNLSVL